MNEERVFGETTIYYIEVKVGGRVLDVVEVWTGCAGDPQWLAEIKARFAQLGPEERDVVIRAVGDVAPKIAAQIQEELAYAEEGPTKKEVRGYAEDMGVTGAGSVRYRDSKLACTFFRDPKCSIGSLHYVKGKDRLLVDRDVGAVESKLRLIPTKYAFPQDATVCMFARPELIERLAVWQQKAWEICQENAAPGEKTKKGRIKITSAYRLLGTTCEWDTCGVVDSSDPFGHWSGYAIDVGRATSRDEFTPNLVSGELVEAARRAGLKQPHSGEGHHFRPIKEYIREE